MGYQQRTPLLTWGFRVASDVVSLSYLRSHFLVVMLFRMGWLGTILVVQSLGSPTEGRTDSPAPVRVPTRSHRAQFPTSHGRGGRTPPWVVPSGRPCKGAQSSGLWGFGNTTPPRSSREEHLLVIACDNLIMKLVAYCLLFHAGCSCDPV